MAFVYRVKLKIGYYERWFEFETSEDAIGFAEAILVHQVPAEDHDGKQISATIEVINKAAEANIDA